MGGISDSIGTIAVEITGDYAPLQTAIDEAAAKAEQGSEQMATSFNEGAAHMESGAHEAEGAFSELGEKVVELATELGLIIGLGEIIEETFATFSNIQSATIAITALTGSTETANEQLEQIDKLASSENLSFPGLLAATQRMDAFGFSTELIPGALEAAADAAVATNSSIDETANALARMAASGNAGSRQLVQLGINTKDMTDVLGVATSDITKTFKELDEDTRLVALQLAELQRHAGDAAAAAGSLKAEWVGVKNTLEDVYIALGKLIEPLATVLLKVPKMVAEGWKSMAQQVQVTEQLIEISWIRMTKGAEAAAAKIKEITDEQAKETLKANPPTPVFTQASFAKQFNADLNNQQWDAAAKLIQQLAQTDLPAATAAMKTLVEKEWEAGEAAKNHKEHLDRLRAITHDYGGDLQILVTMYNEQVAAQKAFDTELGTFGNTVNALARGLTQAQLQAEFLYNAALKTADGIQRIADSTPPVVDDMGNLSATGERTVSTWKELDKATQDWNKTLTTMMGQAKPPVDALEASVSKLLKDFASGNLASAQAIINKIAVDDLPTAVKYQDQLVERLEAAGASQEKLNAAIKEQATLHEQLAQVQGTSLTAYQTKLALVDLQIKNMGFDTQHVFGTVASEAINSMDKSLGQVGNSFAKLIVEGGSFAKTMTQLLNQLAESIIGGLINALVKWGEEFVIEKLLESVTSQATSIAQVTNAAGVGFANAYAATAAIPIIGPEIAPGVAAATEAAILAGGLPMASAAQGAVLGADTLVQAHAEEMILPASLSNGLQDLIANNQTGGSQGNGLTIAIQNMHGVTRDTVDALATSIMRKARLVGAFR